MESQWKNLSDNLAHIPKMEVSTDIGGEIIRRRDAITHHILILLAAILLFLMALLCCPRYPR